MNSKKENTEEKIIDAARTIFVKKGMDGARMQEIADEAGINKALLHYYFRSKEKLFDAILGQIIRIAFPKISSIITSEDDFKSKLVKFIDAYLDILHKHPFLPGFVIKEVNRDASLFFKLIKSHGFNPVPVFTKIQEAMDRGEIIQMRPEHLVANVISLCVFPLAAKPIIEFVGFDGDQKATKQFYAERKEVVKTFVLNAILVKPQST